MLGLDVDNDSAFINDTVVNYCGERGIVSDVEIIPIEKVDEAYDRMVRGDVRYRFVIDLKSLQA